MKTKAITTIMLTLFLMGLLSIAFNIAQDGFTHELEFNMEGNDVRGNSIEIEGEVRFILTEEAIFEAIEEAIEEEEDEAVVELWGDEVEGDFEVVYMSRETELRITSEFSAIEVHVDFWTIDSVIEYEIVSFDVGFGFDMWSEAAPREVFNYWTSVEVFLDEPYVYMYTDVGEATGSIEFEEYGLNYFEVTTEVEEDVEETWVYPIKAEAIGTSVFVNFFSTEGWTEVTAEVTFGEI